MRSEAYTLSKPLANYPSGYAAEQETETTAPRGSESRDNGAAPKPLFRGGGIRLTVIPFYVRNNEPTLREFEIF